MLENRSYMRKVEVLCNTSVQIYNGTWERSCCKLKGFELASSD
jgi:hypothetical protein